MPNKLLPLASESASKPAAAGSTRTGMLERAMLILGSFGPNEVTVSPSALSRRAGLSKATGHRIITEMVNLGMLERTVGGVRVGLRIFEIGQLVPRQRSLRRCAMPVIQDLRDATKLSVHLAVLDQGETLYIEIVSKRQDLPSAVGGRLPAYATGVGKAMLAYSSDEVIEEVGRQRFRRLGPNTMTSVTELREELERIRKEGISFDREESGQGVACVAAPIRNSEGMVYGGISLTGHVREIDFQRFTPMVKTAARIIAGRLERELVAQQGAVEMVRPYREETNSGRV